MAHMVETMAYAGEVPWHGLGEKVEGDLTPEQMLKAAKLDWTVSKRPVYFADKPDVWNLNDPRGEAKMLSAEGHYLITRDTDNKVLSSCGEAFVPFQNKDTMSFFDKFTKAGHMTMDTAGSLRDGKLIWGLAKIKKGFKLLGNDEVEGYLLMSNSHEVGKAMTVMFTPIRVVCNNTITMALNSEGTTGKFRALHLQEYVDADIVKAAEEAIGLSDANMQDFKEKAQFLASKKAETLQVDNFVAELIQPQTLIERGKSKEKDLPPLEDELNKTSKAILDAIVKSPGADLASAKGTWWGALNGVTYVMDHQSKAKSRDNALHSAWFGSAAKNKNKALHKALEYAKVA